MKIGAIAPWFGSKRTMAARVVSELGPHRSYWEPFCGSMAVLLAKEPTQAETVNDLHGDLINLARVIRDPVAGARLWRRLRRVLFAQALLREAREMTLASEAVADALDVDRAEAYFMNSWMGLNGLAGSKAGETLSRGIARRFTSNGGDPATRWQSAIDSIPAWRRRMKSVTILNDNGIELCEKIEDKAGTVIYADPPYLEKSEEYRHDFTDADHDRLAAALGRFTKTKVVVSYYEHPRLAGLYPGWEKIDCTMTKQLGRSDAEVTTAPEVLLVNFSGEEASPLFAE